MQWSKINKKHSDYFRKHPISGIVLADIFEKKKLGRVSPDYKIFLMLIRLFFFGFFNSVFGIKQEDRGLCDGIISAYLNRPNDWGITFPVLNYLDGKGFRIVFVVSSACKKAHSGELAALSNVIIADRDGFRSISNRRIRLRFFSDFFKTFSNDIGILKENKLGSVINYIKTYFDFVMSAEYISRRGKGAKFIFSLGDRRFGAASRLYGMKHFVIQHGHQDDMLSPNYSSFNNFASIVYGEKYKAEFLESYPDTNFVALGNPFYDRINRRNTSDEKKNWIVFFSAFHKFLGDNSLFRGKEHLVFETMDEIIELSEKYKEEYVVKIKLHPNEDSGISGFYRDRNKKFGSEIEIIDGAVDSFQMLENAVIAVSWRSTVNLEAVLVDVLSVQLIKERGAFLPQKYSLVVDSLEELDIILHSEGKIADLKRAQKQVVSKYITNLRCATEKIGDYVISQSINV